ncbi:SET and MYND domain-containing protein 4 [Podospora aff. communis PSN243]|uniref:SET and MYND domain-containing protein 4 n=1 Tax=Podospora aff. communis PSN243 TaxID=3040156 RepID=A0AAV9GXV4_9PEZI|nr:SET and MYND domain-containing protein 4 [Podospora aff. communis PSN243]
MAVAAAPSPAVAPNDIVGELPTKRLSKEQLVKTHMAYIEKHQVAEGAPKQVKQLNPNEAYPASTKSIRDVEIIPLTQLRVETHHRGKGIIVKAASPPYMGGAGALSIIEDEFGNADKLAIYSQPETSILSGVPEGCVVAVKEPYYRFNGTDGDYVICVDHPSDVILLRFTDPIIPEPLRLGPVLKTADDWKKAGDTAFLERDFSTAVFCYSEAIEQATDDSQKAPIYAKRAGTSLLLGRYDAVIADSLASRTGAPSDWKAYYNAGRAAYGLCEYKTSREYLEKALELNSSGSGVRKEYDRCLARLKEEEHGDYDFKAMSESLNPQNVHFDLGSFLRRTFIAESEHHGRGLFAAEDIKAGELVFVEKATFLPNQYDPTRSAAALYAMMMRQLFDNPSLGKTVLKMHPGDYRGTGLEGTTLDGVPIVDVFLLEGIRTKNCFSVPLSTYADTKMSNHGERLAKGLWFHAACLNHSCVPNTMRSFLGDMFISRATRDIKKGEELFQTYIPVKPLIDERNQKYQSSWGFTCNCSLCSIERTSSVFSKRKELANQVEKACDKKNSSKEIMPDAVIRNIERLQKQLEDMHEPEVYDSVPRLTLIYPCTWLVEAFRGRKNWPKVLKYGVRVLRNFGFEAPLEEGVEWDPRKMWSGSSRHSLMTIHVVAALRRLSQASKELKMKEMAERYEEAARIGYMMVTGFENELSGITEKD